MIAEIQVGKSSKGGKVRREVVDLRSEKGQAVWVEELKMMAPSV